MMESFKSQRKQSKAPVVAVWATTFCSCPKLPANPPLPAGTLAPILKNPQQSTSTFSVQALTRIPPTNAAGYGSLAVVKQLWIHAPGNVDGFGSQSGDRKWLACPQSWFLTLFMFLHFILHVLLTAHHLGGGGGLYHVCRLSIDFLLLWHRLLLHRFSIAYDKL